MKRETTGPEPLNMNDPPRRQAFWASETIFRALNELADSYEKREAAFLALGILTAHAVSAPACREADGPVKP